MYDKDITYTGGSCCVKVGVTRAYKYDSDIDYIVVTTYDTEGTLVGFSFFTTTALAANTSSEFSCLINIDKSISIGRVKAFVWDNFTNFEPLAESRSLVLDPDSPVPSDPTPAPDLGNCVYVDGTLVTALSDDCLRIRKSEYTNLSTEYKLNGAALYVNGKYYCDISASTANDAYHALKNSIGDTVLVEDTSKSGYYNKIMINFYAIGTVSQVTSNRGVTRLALSGLICQPFYGFGNNIEICEDDIANGDVTLSVIKDGAVVDLSYLSVGDIVAVKHDVKCKFSDSSFLEIIASSAAVTGVYEEYDTETDLYTIDGAEYKVAPYTLYYDDIEVGNSYTFYLDPFGRLYDYLTYYDASKFAVVESYVNKNANASLNSSIINVVTLDGQYKTLNIDPAFEETAAYMFEGMAIGNTAEVTAANVSICDRIIGFSARPSTGAVIDAFQLADYTEFTQVRYKPAANRLGKPLSLSAVMLDASSYDMSAGAYKTMAIASLADNREYDGWVFGRDENGEYNFVILTKISDEIPDEPIIDPDEDNYIYNSTSDFAVAAMYASEASKSTFDGVSVYKLRVMKDGGSAAEYLYINLDAEIYYAGMPVRLTDIKQGSVFYYTTDECGIANEINIVYKGESYWYTLLRTDMLDLVKLPYGSADNMFNENNWGATINRMEISGSRTIQLLLAPVCMDTNNSVSVAPICMDSRGFYYIDTNQSEDFAVNAETKIYAYDMSGDYTGSNAFSDGHFIGFDYQDTDEDGRAWFSNYEDNYNHEETIQMAFMMVVDGTVTNALVFNN